MNYLQRKLQHVSASILRTAFDASQFEEMTHTEATSTERVYADEGEYPAILDRYEFRTGVSGEGKPYTFFDVLWSIDSEEQRMKMQRDKVLVRQSFGLQMNESGTGLATGKGVNVELGKLREALGQNADGMPWKFAMLKGAGPALVRVKHRTFKNKANEDETNAEVAAVTKI